MDLQLRLCPKCGSPATLLQTTETFEDIPDLSSTDAKARVRVKVDEFRCQDPGCEHEFEIIVRE